MTSLKKLDSKQGESERLKGNQLTIIGHEDGVRKINMSETTREATQTGESIYSDELPSLAQNAQSEATQVFSLLEGLPETCKKEAATELKPVLYGAWKDADYRIAHNIALNNSNKIDTYV